MGTSEFLPLKGDLTSNPPTTITGSIPIRHHGAFPSIPVCEEVLEMNKLRQSTILAW